MTEIKTKIEQILALPVDIKAQAIAEVFGIEPVGEDLIKIITGAHLLGNFEYSVSLFKLLESKLPVQPEQIFITKWVVLYKSESDIFDMFEVLYSTKSEATNIHANDKDYQGVYPISIPIIQQEKQSEQNEKVSDLENYVEGFEDGLKSGVEYQPEQGRDLESVFKKYASDGWGLTANLLDFNDFQKAVQELQQPDWFPDESEVMEWCEDNYGSKEDSKIASMYYWLKGLKDKK